jgi:putative DNA modification/repair radical SAM protein
VPRAAFLPQELARLTIEFYRRNYIEGLFLSSGVVKSPDYTMEQIIRALELIRYQHNFRGYIHAKAIPGASPGLVHKLGLLADRLSVNIEMPSELSLKRLAPQKSRRAILTPMAQIAAGHKQSEQEPAIYRNAPKFAVAGQATQMIIGASPESDYQIIRLASGLYSQYALKRVFYSAYIPTVEDTLLPAIDTKPPLLREHRLYQADWLMRQYHFTAEELLSEQTPNFNPYLDPKCNWAIHNLHVFPVDVNAAPRELLLRVPGIGPESVRRILYARRAGRLGLDDLKKIGVVLKRARYFILCADRPRGIHMGREAMTRALIDPGAITFGTEQLSMFDTAGTGLPGSGDVKTMQEAVEEAVLCLLAGI